MDEFKTRSDSLLSLMSVLGNIAPGCDHITSSIGATITEGVREYAAEQGIAEEDALKKRMEAKSKEFLEKGAEAYAKV